MTDTKHNHITRDIKPLGQCPACDEYHDRHIPKPDKKPKDAREWSVSSIYDSEADAFRWFISKPFEVKDCCVPEDIRVIEYSAFRDLLEVVRMQDETLRIIEADRDCAYKAEEALEKAAQKLKEMGIEI